MINAEPIVRLVGTGGDILPAGHFFAGLRANYYRFIYLDPATKFVGGTKGRPQHYPRMSDEAIGALPLRDLAHPDGAWIGCWISSPKYQHVFRYNAGWIRKGVRVPGWGGKYSARMFVWVKTHRRTDKLSAAPMFVSPDSLFIGTGYTTRKNCEDVALFKFGHPKRISKSIREVILAPAREHSRKPDEARDRIVKFAAGPYCELFSRGDDPRFDHWGYDVGQFQMAAAA